MNKRFWEINTPHFLANPCFINKAPLLHQYHLTLHTSRQAQQASRPPGGGHVPPGATRLDTHCLYTIAWWDIPHRQAPCIVHTLCNTGYRLVGWAPSPGATPVQCIVLALLHFIWLLVLNHTIAHLQNIDSLNGCLISNVFTPIWLPISIISMGWFF